MDDQDASASDFRDVFLLQPLQKFLKPCQHFCPCRSNDFRQNWSDVFLFRLLVNFGKGLWIMVIPTNRKAERWACWLCVFCPTWKHFLGIVFWLFCERICPKFDINRARAQRVSALIEVFQRYFAFLIIDRETFRYKLWDLEMLYSFISPNLFFWSFLHYFFVWKLETPGMAGEQNLIFWSPPALLKQVERTADDSCTSKVGKKHFGAGCFFH